MHELQLHAWNDVLAEGRHFVVDLMDDAGTLYEKAPPPPPPPPGVCRSNELLWSSYYNQP